MKLTRIAILSLVLGALFLVMPKHASAKTPITGGTTPPFGTPNQ
jgi:hypothetical protein